MSLITVVTDFVHRVRTSPKLGTDPAELSALLAAARKSWDGAFAARHAPIAPMTWEQQALLLGVSGGSERTAFRFPHAMEVVSFYASVVALVPHAGGGTVVPTLDDIQVQLDINNTNILTTLEGVSTAAAGATRGGTFVTLGAVHINPSRLIGLKLRGPNPELGATFRWKQGTAGAPVYFDSLVSLAIAVRRCGDDDRDVSSNVPSMAGGL